MKLTLALGQMDVQEANAPLNLSKANAFASQAVEAGAELLLLPELWVNGFILDQAEEITPETGQGYFNEMETIAGKSGITLCGSTLRKTGQGNVRNSSRLVYPDIPPSSFYDKLHLFELMQEQTYLEQGDIPLFVDTNWGRIGLAICYDLRFPELFRYYALQGVPLILVSAQWPRPRLNHWRLLLQARAIENQVFIAACNRVGENSYYSFFGHSMVIDPAGDILLELDEDEQVREVELDLGMVDQVRSRMPVLPDYRSDLF